MALSNKPGRSLYQIGDTVYFLNGKKIGEGGVTKVVTAVSNPLNDSTGIQENYYYVDGLDQIFTESELFHSKNALLFELKGDYLGKFKSAALVYLEAIDGFDLSFIDLANTVFDGARFTAANLEGANLMNCNLNVSFEHANLKNCNLYGSIFATTSFVGANLTGSTLPANANTKSTFKSMVGAGNWDPVTTIWTDGLPIGN